MRWVARSWVVVVALLSTTPVAPAFPPPGHSAGKLVRVDVIIAQISRGSGELTLPTGVVLEPAVARAAITLLQELVHEGRAKVLARPSLTTPSGKKAVYFDGVEKPLVVRAGPGDEEARVEFARVGTSVQCLPTVLENDKISLEIEWEISGPGPDGDRRDGQSGSAAIKLQSGETHVTDGMIRRETVVKQLPMSVLGQLPLIGPLFIRTTEIEEERELVCIVTVTLPSRSER